MLFLVISQTTSFMITVRQFTFTIFKFQFMATSNVSSRVNELLEAVKKEFEDICQKTKTVEAQKDDFEYKGILYKNLLTNLRYKSNTS